MGAFIEPEFNPNGVIKDKPKVFTTEFLDDVVKKSIAAGEIPADHNFVLVAATDEQGVKFMAGVVRNTVNHSLSVNFIAEHDWSGDNKIGAKVVYSHK